MVALFTDPDPSDTDSVAPATSGSSPPPSTPPSSPRTAPLHAARSVVGDLHDESDTPCQDLFSISSVPCDDAAPIRIYAVLDGHGPLGEQVAATAASTLATSVAERLSKRVGASADGAAARHEAALRAAFAKTAEVVDSDQAACKSGTTATVVVVEDRVLSVANIGDSGAVIARGGVTAELLSVDHRPTNEEEKLRIEEAGGIVQNGYVCDADPPSKIISVTRAFGDLDVRAIGVVSVPQIKSYTIEDGTDFLILATDGLWDAHGGMSPQKAVDTVVEYMNGDEAHEADDVAKGAVDALIALAKGTCRFPFDDATVIVVCPRPQS